MRDDSEIVRELRSFLTKVREGRRPEELVQDYAHAAFMSGQAQNSLEAFTVGLISYFTKLELESGGENGQS